MATESAEVDGFASAQGVWGHLLSADQLQMLMTPPKIQDKGNKRHKPGGGKDKQKETPSHKDVVTVPRQVISTLTRLVLRHEDSLNAVLTEAQFLLHITPGPGSVLPDLLQKSQQWHGGD